MRRLTLKIVTVWGAFLLSHLLVNFLNHIRERLNCPEIPQSYWRSSKFNNRETSRNAWKKQAFCNIMSIVLQYFF